ncbi:transposable element Tcb1 transposase [Trichonephila clavipes]|nr:transposable element Tcb1 transposase [Trichonephila clavipes]
MVAEFLFMDDNARPHHANIVDECLQSEDITRMDWPAYSPDLNPIEHVWDMLGRRIAVRQPPPTCLPELRRALLDEWCNIPQDQIDNWILSMPRRCSFLKFAPGKNKAKNKAILMIPPLHPWYQSKYSGDSLVRGSSRGDQTTLTRFLSGHLMSLTFVDGIKHFEICPKCSAQASPGHILSCFGLTRQDLVQDPLLVLDFFRVNGLMDLI